MCCESLNLTIGLSDILWTPHIYFLEVLNESIPCEQYKWLSRTPFNRGTAFPWLQTSLTNQDVWQDIGSVHSIYRVQDPWYIVDSLLVWIPTSCPPPPYPPGWLGQRKHNEKWGWPLCIWEHWLPEHRPQSWGTWTWTKLTASLHSYNRSIYGEVCVIIRGFKVSLLTFLQSWWPWRCCIELWDVIWAQHSLPEPARLSGTPCDSG